MTLGPSDAGILGLSGFWTHLRILLNLKCPLSRKFHICISAEKLVSNSRRSTDSPSPSLNRWLLWRALRRMAIHLLTTQSSPALSRETRALLPSAPPCKTNGDGDIEAMRRQGLHQMTFEAGSAADSGVHQAGAFELWRDASAAAHLSQPWLLGLGQLPWPVLGSVCGLLPLRTTHPAPTILSVW